MTEPAGGQPGSSGVQWVGRNPDNQLPYVCWNHLPACIQNGDGAPFKTLFQGGYVIYFFALVHKIGRWMLPQNRVLMVTHAAVYQCMLTSHINRCVKIENLAEVYCLRRKNENWLGVKVDRARAPKEHDMLFDVAAPKVLDNFKAVVGRLYRDKMKKELPMLELGKDQSIKRFLHLKKDADFEVKKEPFVLQRDVWRAHAQRKKRAFDDSRAPSTAPSISGLAIEETVHLLKTETDSPCGLPRFPSEDRSPSPAPALGPAALGPAPAVRAVPSLGDRAASVDGRPPIAPPAQPAAAPAKPQYRMDEPLLVRRSSGHWDPCRVFDVRAESYLVETTETLAQKEVFFDDTDALLRRPPQDHRGLEVRVRDRVRLTAAVGGVSPGAVGTVVQIPGAAGHAVASARFPGRDAPLDVAAADIEWCSTDHSGAIVGYEDEVELLRDVTYDCRVRRRGGAAPGRDVRWEDCGEGHAVDSGGGAGGRAPRGGAAVCRRRDDRREGGRHPRHRHQGTARRRPVRVEPELRHQRRRGGRRRGGPVPAAPPAAHLDPPGPPGGAGAGAARSDAVFGGGGARGGRRAGGGAVVVGPAAVF
eukprot:TRINITY_DN4814_c0_g1_i1.p1 TRINITY_DN4814_c0_g1~~TRINITY_DN4814_c0_g1_i1.p1  ORF type:complete len:588 (+),score=109.17 TRINITY_DN4814_c0_g1_i1:116-1879(+)